MNAPAKLPRLSTTLSTRGQVVLPQTIRERLGWRAGERLIVEDTDDGVFLRREAKRPASRLEDVMGILKWRGSAYSPKEVRVRSEAAVRDKWLRIEETGSAYPDDGSKE